MKEEIILVTADHPQANGRIPCAGETEYPMRFPLDDGRELVLKLGQKGFDVVTNLLVDMLSEAPSYNDGTTNNRDGLARRDQERVIGAADYLCADEVCAHLVRNLEIDFSLHGESWDRDQAEMHFKGREALIRVRELLLDSAEELRIQKE